MSLLTVAVHRPSLRAEQLIEGATISISQLAFKTATSSGFSKQCTKSEAVALAAEVAAADVRSPGRGVASQAHGKGHPFVLLQVLCRHMHARNAFSLKQRVHVGMIHWQQLSCRCRLYLTVIAAG